MYNGVYPAYIKPYVTPRQNVQRKEEQQQQGQQGSTANQEDLQNRGNAQTYRTTSYQLPGYNGFRAQIQQSKPQQKKAANAQNINISQIITDFRSTANAVGAPQDITNEVFAYLDLIQTQSAKESPNKKIIQSNLKNASQVLDGYISKTLQTPSTVVENWIDALFLQNIDFKADPNAINKDFKLNFENEAEGEKISAAADKEEKADVQKTVSDSQSKRNYVPEDEKMRALFVHAKHSVREKDTKTALISLKRALNYAVETEDVQMQSMIYFETADLYNKNGHYAQALKGYKIAADMTQDENLIATSYMKTGKIYDEAGLIEPAKKHWLSAIGYAGESDNLPIQVKALNHLAKVQSEIYDKKMTYTFVNLANSLAEETKNDKIKGYSYKNSSKVSEYLDDNAKALQFLKASTKAYSKVQDNKNVIDNFISAADIMANVGNSQKARALLNKAFLTAIDTDDKNALNIISNKIALLAA
ncbi:MAG: hypothetical protein K6C94_05255 [Candidatus Gastranaerophilales bacterium]|nr:hypothetical protein [Candidatus Gastranaerophilales bacterium]